MQIAHDGTISWLKEKVTITEDEFDKLASGNYSLSVFSTKASATNL